MAGHAAAASWARDRSMVPERSDLPEDEAGHAGVAEPADGGKVADPARDEDVHVVAADERVEEAEVRGRTAVAQHQAMDAHTHQLLHQRIEGWRTRPAPGERGDPLCPGIDAHGKPVAGDGHACTERLRALDDGDREDHPGGPGRERESDVVSLLEAARDLERHGHPGRDRAHSAQVDGGRPLCAVEVHEVQDPRAPADELLGDAVRPVGGRARAGRRARPVDDPRPPLRHVDGRDDVHSPQPSPVEQAAVEADRQRPVAQQRVVECLEREVAAEPAPLVLAHAQDEHLAQQVAELVARRVRVPADLRAGVRGLERGVLDEEVGGLVGGQLAAVHPHVEDDPARSPDGVCVHGRPERRGRRRSPPRASSARSTCPTPPRTPGRR